MNENEIIELIISRINAYKMKNYIKYNYISTLLKEKGIILSDNKHGTFWKKVSILNA